VEEAAGGWRMGKENRRGRGWEEDGGLKRKKEEEEEDGGCSRRMEGGGWRMGKVKGRGGGGGSRRMEGGRGRGEGGEGSRSMEYRRGRGGGGSGGGSRRMEEEGVEVEEGCVWDNRWRRKQTEAVETELDTEMETFTEREVQRF